jgi:hypothetical protein
MMAAIYEQHRLVPPYKHSSTDITVGIVGASIARALD